MPQSFLTRLTIRAALLATSGSALALTPPTTPVVPRYEVVDAVGSIGVNWDIAIAPAGARPAMLYYDMSGADPVTPGPVALKLARYDRFSWVNSTLGTVNLRDSPVDNKPVRLAIDQNGAAHALVVESNDAGGADDALIYFGHDAQGAPIREQIDSADVLEIALTVDIIAEPYVAYIKGASRTLVIRRRANGAWQEITLSQAATEAHSPSFAPYPADANFFAMQLAWVERATFGSSMRHAVVSTQFATSSVIVTGSNSTSLGAPQLVVDRFGTLEVAYSSHANVLAPTIELRRRVVGEPSWQCIDTGCSLPTGPLPISTGVPLHGYVQGALNYLDADFGWRMLRREGPDWVSYGLADISTATGAVRDRDGSVYTMSWTRDGHRDLHAVRIGGPWESRGRIPFDENIMLTQPLDVASDAAGHPVVYARRAFGAADPRGALWLFGADEDYVEHPLPGAFTAADASVAVAADGTIHVALHDSDQGDLVHAAFTPDAENGNWAVTRVDTKGDVGASPTMLIGADGTPMIVYRRRPDLMHLAARSPAGDWVIRTLSAGVLEAARPTAVASRDAFIVHVSWFDEVAEQLRVSTLHGDPLNPNSSVRNDLVPPTLNRVRGRVHDVAMLGDGGVAVAHSDESGGQSQLGYRYRDYTGQWRSAGEQPAPFEPGAITRISLDSALLAATHARVAWIAGGRLRYAQSHLGASAWDNEDLGPIPAAAPMQFGAAGPLRIIYDEGDGLFVLQRLEDLGVDGVIDIVAYGPGIGHVISYCACTLRFNPTPANCPDGLRSKAGSAALDLQKAIGPSTANGDVLAELRGLFSTTPAGRYYLQLFTEHADEIIQLTLSDPQLLEQRTRTLSDLLPGLTALVDSPAAGQQFRLKPEQIANARAVWEGWASAGSPALAAAVNNELARTDNLEQFTNMSFTDWFDAISVGDATEQIHDDGFE